jgi:hypothetical protein
MKNILNFEDGKTVRSTVATLYIYIYIVSDYGALQSTRVLCVLCFIVNFKSEMTDPNVQFNLHIKIY